MVSFVAVAAFSFLITLNQTVYQFLSSYCSSLSASIPELAALTGIIASSCMAGQAIGKVILGAINDRSVRGGMTFGIGSGIVGVLLMMLVPQVPALLLIGAFLFGFVYACTTVQVPLLTRKAFPTGDYTAIYSRVSTLGALGSVIATMLWSFIIELPSGYDLMFCLSIACMVGAYVLGSLALRPEGDAHQVCNQQGKETS
jgi:MFS family permease